VDVGLEKVHGKEEAGSEIAGEVWPELVFS